MAFAPHVNPIPIALSLKKQSGVHRRPVYPRMAVKAAALGICSRQDAK
jgi:hypothetical protein